MDYQQRTSETLRELALFAGAGGGILGGKLLGWRTVCAVEIEPYAVGVLVARQNEGLLPPFPIWDDVSTFDGRPWRGCVDVVSGGFPCQDISSAGKGAGIDGHRSGLWREMARIIGEVRPRYAFMENSPMLTFRGLGRVLGDLAAMGYDAEWGVLGAEHANGIHRRHRVWILAYSNEDGLQRSNKRLQKVHGEGRRRIPEVLSDEDSRWPKKDTLPQPFIVGVNDGVAARVDRLAAIGNGQVPIVAATAFKLLHERIASR